MLSFWPQWGFGIVGNNTPEEFMIRKDNVNTFIIKFPQKTVPFLFVSVIISFFNLNSSLSYPIDETGSQKRLSLHKRYRGLIVLPKYGYEIVLRH